MTAGGKLDDPNFTANTEDDAPIESMIFPKGDYND